jgi:O-antigen/teichoic acid export membrane protein
LKRYSSYLFIAISVFVAGVGFLRSFVFMYAFDFKDLGTITIINTSTVLIGFFQFGIINGGYRIVALQDYSKYIKTNNFVFTYFTFLFFLLLLASVLFYLFSTQYDLTIILFVVALGFLTLVFNWLSISLIGSLKYKILNVANSLSALISITCTFFSLEYGIKGILVSLILQPLFFILIVFLSDKKQIPNKLNLDLLLFKEILSYGFIPFLASVFFLLYIQIERWSINYILGKESLGKLFLFFIIFNFWNLIPSSVLNLFYPRAIKLFSDNKSHEFKRIIKQNLLFVFVYSSIGCILILLLFKPSVFLFFPKHSDYSMFVVLALPGLAFRSFTDPLSLYFNSVLKLKFIFWSDILSLIIYVLSLSVFYLHADFTLKHFIYCFDIYFVSKFLLLLIPYLKIKRSF